MKKLIGYYRPSFNENETEDEINQRIDEMTTIIVKKIIAESNGYFGELEYKNDDKVDKPES